MGDEIVGRAAHTPFSTVHRWRSVSGRELRPGTMFRSVCGYEMELRRDIWTDAYLLDGMNRCTGCFPVREQEAA